MHSKIIDCTFRDGGYYTDWYFDKSLVEETLDVLSRLPVEYVEIGFRKYKDKNELGPNLYTTEEYINSLVIPKGQKIALMMMLTHFDGYTDDEIVACLVPKKDSRVDLIRVGVYLSEIEFGLRICELIQGLGYKVSLNLVRINKHSNEELLTFLSHLESKTLDVVCFADTLGDMTSGSLVRMLEASKDIYSGELGFHAHNNRGMSMENAFCAISKNIKWIDASISGMGRGAGNLPLESFLIDFSSLKNLDLDLTELLDLCERVFWPLREKHKWGYNSYYHMASIKGIHPTHVQKVLAENHFANHADKMRLICS